MPKNVTVQRIISILLHRIKLIIAAGMIGGLLFFFYTTFFITPMYSTSTMIYIQNYNRTSTQRGSSDDVQSSASGNDSSSSNNDVAGKIFLSDISGSATLAKNSVTLFRNSDKITELYSGCNVAISVEDGTFYITISATGSDPQTCANVANQVADQCGTVFSDFFAYGQIGTIREAKVPSAPMYPNKTRNTLMGVAVGLIAACVIAILLELIDTTIKPDEDLAEMYKIPVFAEIPDFESQGR